MKLSLIRKRVIVIVAVISIGALSLVSCTVPAKLSEYVVKAYNVSNDIVGVLKGVQEDPQKITEVIDSLVSGAETLRDALQRAGELLGQELEDPKSKSATTDLDASTLALKEALAEDE